MKRFLFLVLALGALLLVGCGAEDPPSQTSATTTAQQSTFTVDAFLAQFSDLIAEAATIEEARQNDSLLVYYVTDINVGDKFTLTLQNDAAGDLISALLVGPGGSLSAFPSLAMNVCTAMPLPSTEWLDDFGYFIGINEYTARVYGDWLVCVDPDFSGEVALTVSYIRT